MRLHEIDYKQGHTCYSCVQFSRKREKENNKMLATTNCKKRIDFDKKYDAALQNGYKFIIAQSFSSHFETIKRFKQYFKKPSIIFSLVS